MKDLEKKSDQDLEKMLRDKRRALFNFRVGIAGSKIKNVKEARKLKKEIAQILTLNRVRRVDHG